MSTTTTPAAMVTSRRLRGSDRYRPILIGGDWNALPGNLDQYRPRWVAARADLGIASAGPGSFGDIDYPMSDAQLTDVRRGMPRGSDHDPVLWVASWNGHQLRGATWNLLAGRDPDTVATEVAQLVAAAQLDVVLVQECSRGYPDALRAKGLAVVGEGEQRVVLRAGVSHVGVRHHRLSRAGWPLFPGASQWHTPATATSVRVAGWLRVVSVHLPNYERTRWHALAYRQAATRLARYVTRRRRLMR